MDMKGINCPQARLYNVFAWVIVDCVRIIACEVVALFRGLFTWVFFGVVGFCVFVLSMHYGDTIYAACALGDFLEKVFFDSLGDVWFLLLWVVLWWFVVGLSYGLFVVVGLVCLW